MITMTENAPEEIITMTENDQPSTTPDALADPIATAIAAHGRAVSDTRRKTLQAAVAVGATADQLLALCRAIRVGRGPTCILPAHRYESLSRGRGWARKGSRGDVQWGERTDDGYRVGPGRWIVGATDGFSRKGQDTYTVRAMTVGSATWTVAD